jgi:CO/xanthine dehydrogenase Mo-binding subunit
MDSHIAQPVVGKSVKRIDSLDKVTGKAIFPGDLSRPGMLHLKILFAGRPHARILDIETQDALALPGVVGVFTSLDVPHNEYGLAIADQPVLCQDVVRFEGDQVAVIAAESEEAAAQGRDLIRVTYEDLPIISDPCQAMEPGCLQVHPDRPGNILKYIPIRKGDVEQGFSQADVIVESAFYLPMQEHAYLQPEAGLAYMDGDTVVVETGGQWAHHDRRQIAHALGLPDEKVRVIYRYIGGSFGGREDISVQIILALAAYKTGRPVKIIWSREESIRGHCKRHQTFISARWGATREGKIIAASVKAVMDAGAYAYTSTMVLGHVAYTSLGVYEIPNVHVDAYAIYTNNIPGGAFRGFGSPQGIFCAELQMEKIAARLGIDPVEIRMRNLLHRDSLLAVGTPLPFELHLERQLEECARAAGWTQDAAGWKKPAAGPTRHAERKYGIGLAIGFKNIGFSFGFPEVSSITIELHGQQEVERVLVRYSGAEVGQGTHTAIAQMAAQALGLPIDIIYLITTDTANTLDAGCASASRLTLMAGNAILGAAGEVMKLWKNEERPAVASYTYHAPLTSDFDPETGKGVPNFTYSSVAQAVEVEVDTQSGQVEVLRVITVTDVGKAINPLGIEGQVEGSVAQGLGYAFMEEFITHEGQTLTPNLSTYLPPTALDMPGQMQTIILELDEPCGPWGAKGVGESVILATAPAAVTAVQQATGQWIDRLPMTPPRVLRAISSQPSKTTA